MPPGEPLPPFPDWPRYAPERPLPRYRYVPGLHPHPISDPAGHSYGHRASASDGDFAYAVDLYNFAYWWEAHEAWEGSWQKLDRRAEEAQFLQGLIQTSAGLLKAHLGSRGGTEALLGEALRRLEPVARAHPVYRGIAMPEHIARIRACRGLALPLPADRLPLIRLV